MDKINVIATKMDAKIDKGYAFIRMFLGIALSIRGWIILSNPNSIIEMGLSRDLFLWIAVIGIVHLVAGILLCLGFLARFAALIQIPILFSAIFYVHDHIKLMMGNQSLELAVLVLFLLCIYLVYGPGTFSVRAYFTKLKA